MTLIDDRGRLFGCVNLVDVGIASLAIAATAALVVAFQVMRLPRGPEVTSVDPANQTASNGARVQLHGRDFMPFLRVFVRHNGSRGLVHDIARPADPFTLANLTQAAWVVESPILAEVRLPDAMSAGTYDLVFANETRQLSVALAAFTLTAPASSSIRLPTAVVRLEGAFTQVPHADAAHLAPGTKASGGDGDEIVEIVSVSPSQPDVVTIEAGGVAVPAAVDGRLRVPASLKVHCTVEAKACLLGRVPLTSGAVVGIHLGAQEFRFVVGEVAAAGADAAEADVSVRFVMRPEGAALMMVGDLDAADASSAARDPRSSAVLKSIASRAPVTRRTLETVDKKPSWVEEPAVRIDAVLRVPVTQVDGVAIYKGQALKSGGTIAFETPAYKAQAWVLNVTTGGRAKGRSRE